jgi:hypothetical protein
MSDEPVRRYATDPTTLTTEQLRREVLMLRELLESRIGAVEKASEVFSDNLQRVPTQLDREISKILQLMEERFTCMNTLIQEKETRWKDVEKRNQTAIETALTARMDALNELRVRFVHMPKEWSEDIDHLRGIQNEKFESVQRQFAERDTRAEASEKAAKLAVDAALSAQKEAAAAQNASNAAAIQKSEAATTKQLDGILALLGQNNQALSDKIVAITGRLDRNEGKDTGQGKNQATMIAVAAVLVSVVVGGFAISNSFRIGSGGGGQSYPSPGPTGSVTVPIPAAPR